MTNILRNEIKQQLHTLTPHRAIVIVWANVTITHADYQTVTNARLGDVMSNPAELDRVLDRLDAIANSRWVCA